MKKIARTMSILVLSLLIWPALGHADIVYVKNGDKLFGTIRNSSFTVQAPYGKVSIKNEFLKSLGHKDGSTGHWTIETINNDRFSGRLLNDTIEFIEENGKQRTLKIGQIQRIKREINGPSYLITTTIFTMKNNDRFSGKFLGTGLEIKANHITKSIKPAEINRIEFGAGNRGYTSILLENGDLISGVLNQDQIRLDPDAIDEFTVAKSGLKCIQFNAPKMVLNKFGNFQSAEKDSDGDGIPDFADICMDTPGGVAVGPDGCREKTVIAKSVNKDALQKQSAGDFELWSRFFRHAGLYGVDSRLAAFRQHLKQKTALDLPAYVDESREIFRHIDGRKLPTTVAFFRKWITRLPSSMRRCFLSFGWTYAAEIIVADNRTTGWRIVDTAV